MTFALVASVLMVSTTGPAPAAPRSTQLHQVAIFDGHLMQRSRIDTSACANSDCWSHWYDRTHAEPPGSGELTAVSYFTAGGVLHEWVVRTSGDHSRLWIRVDNGAWIDRVVPGDGPITSLTSTVNSDGSVETYYWRGTSRDHAELQAYRQEVQPDSEGYVPGEKTPFFEFEALASESRDEVYGVMNGDLTAVRDEWLVGPVVSHTLFTDHEKNRLIQGIWIDSNEGNHGFWRFVDLVSGKPDWDSGTWEGPLSEWEMGMGAVTGQTYFYGPAVVDPATGRQLAADANLVRLENTEGRSFCSGTLVSSRMVLTAAHCLYATLDGEAPHVRQRRAIEDIRVRLRTQGAEEALVYTPTAEPIFPTLLDEPGWLDLVEDAGFGPGTVVLPRQHDIALIELPEQVPDTVRVARYRFETPNLGTKMTATGWLRDSTADFVPEQLILTRTRCEDGVSLYSNGHFCLETDDQNRGQGGMSGMSWRTTSTNLIAGVYTGTPDNGPNTALATPMKPYGEMVGKHVWTGVRENVRNRQRVVTEVSVPFTAGWPAQCLPGHPDRDNLDIPEFANVVVTLELEETGFSEAHVSSVHIGNLSRHRFHVPQFELAGFNIAGKTLERNGEPDDEIVLVPVNPVSGERFTIPLFNGEDRGQLDFLKLEYADGTPCEYLIDDYLNYELIS